MKADAAVTTRSGQEVRIGPLDVSAERDELFALFAEIVETGEGWPHSAPLTEEAFDATWVTPVRLVVGAHIGGALAGAYVLKPNFPGRAGHIANAGYIVGRAFRRLGVGRSLIEDSISRAPLLGFDAIQFNLVFASNPARPLYTELGWRQIGAVPRAVDGEEAIIYWRDV